ncbi:ATP-binding protein, partial [Staphylococcus aureus]|nr:ATP-binding protein [Staphylococcus aureus]
AERSSIEGTGIGLVIVRKLLEAMDGRLEVLSEPGKGSRFIAWVPLSTTEAEQPATTEFGDLGPDDAHGAELVVLYAEDNDVNVELVRQV